MVLPF